MIPWWAVSPNWAKSLALKRSNFHNYPRPHSFLPPPPHHPSTHACTRTEGHTLWRLITPFAWRYSRVHPGVKPKFCFLFRKCAFWPLGCTYVCLGGGGKFRNREDLERVAYIIFLHPTIAWRHVWEGGMKFKESSVFYIPDKSQAC